MLRDSTVGDALINSVVYMLVCLPVLTVLPLLLAVLVEKKLPGIGFFRTAFYTPVIASAVVVGLLWPWLLADRGLINPMVRALGAAPITFLPNTISAELRAVQECVYTYISLGDLSH